MKSAVLLFILIAGLNLSAKTTELSCAIAKKSLQAELGNSLSRPSRTAQKVWSELISKQIYDKRAKFLANEYGHAQKKFLNVLKRKSKRFSKKDKTLDQSEDNRLIKLQDELTKTKAKYNKYILKNLRTSLAKQTVKSNTDSTYYNYNFTKDPQIQFKSNLFDDDLNIENNKNLNLEFFDQKDTNGSLYSISIDSINTKNFLISKSGNESAVVSDLVSQTLGDGYYYKVSTIYEYEIGTDKPVIKLTMTKHKNEDDPEILDSKDLNLDSLIDLVSERNCSNGIAIRQVPAIVIEDGRMLGKDLKDGSEQKTESPTEANKE